MNKNNKIKLLVNGENAFPEIIECIENAKESVNINMFIWRDDTVGNRVAEAVLTAADNGAKVFISVDRYGVVLEKCEESKKSFFHKKLSFSEKIKITALEIMYPENGKRGKVKDEYTELYRRVTQHPNIEISADRFKADHSKYYIIDGEILFLGGINIEDKENGRDICGRAYGDYMIKLCGREYVAALIEKINSGKNILDGIFFGLNIKEPQRRFEMERLYLDMINEAENELHITMAYFSPLKKFINAIFKAYERGVRVTLIVPKKANFQNDSNMRTVRKLLKATNGGITVYLSPKMLHTKLIINDKYISLGSTNITKKAFKQLSELNVFLKNEDSELANALKESVACDIATASRVSSYKNIKYNRLIAFFEGFLV